MTNRPGPPSADHRHVNAARQSSWFSGRVGTCAHCPQSCNGHGGLTTTLRAIPLIALLLAGCAADPGESSSATSQPASDAATDSGGPSATAVASSAESPAPLESPTQATSVVDPPSDLLPPGSVARVTGDGLRVRGGPPGTPDHEKLEYTLNEGDLVLVEWSPLAYIAPSESADRRGWYNVHVGGASVMSHIDGGVNGWVAAGEDGLEYLEHVPVTCGPSDLENLIYSPFTGGDQEMLTTPWERLACNGDRQLEVTGVLDLICPEGGVYPYRFEPHLAAPQWCLALMIDAIDADGNAQYGQGLVVRFPEFVPSELERGDVLRMRGHFDDPAATSCSAETDPGFDGAAVDVPFLVLFCREQFVPDEWEVIDHRQLAPSPWES